jgi:penicillin amidase/acyl-homoserine-lactone acylase
VRGKLASVRGPSAAPGDYVVALLGIWKDALRGWDRDLDPRTRAILDAYAAGVEFYAKLHPSEVWDGLLPVRGQDVLAGFVLRSPFFFGLDATLRDLYRTGGAFAEAEQVAAIPFAAPAIGSNTFAIAPSRAADGRAHLLVNSHQPWTGPVAWYEAHVHSDEGWDAVGGVFPGSPVILHGHNRDLGWAFTVNRPDLVDVYRLEINPANRNQYRFDGAWRNLEVERVAIRVRLFGFLPFTADRQVLRSVHGPVLRLPHGSFAIRWAGMGEVRQVEQWYRMNRAASFDAWRDAMRMQAIPSLNAAYADRSGRIAYFYNAKLPVRAPGYDWTGVVPGDTSQTLWTEFLPFDAMPKVVNPPSGFVQNCNSSPFETTLGAGNPRPEDFPASAGIETRMTNRALRALELLGADSAITDAELRDIKFDVTVSERSEPFAHLERALAAVDAAGSGADALETSAAELLRSWDRRADSGSRATTLALFTLYPLIQARHDGRPEPDPRASLRAAARLLTTRHGRLDPPWSWVNRMRRGAVAAGLDGAPDVLHAVEGPLEHARVAADSGDGLMFFVSFGKDGVRSESLHQYGSATSRPASPHYADQVPLFVAHQPKPVWLDEAEIRAHLEREYRPGEELDAPAR